jgi:hypothetical protein
MKNMTTTKARCIPLSISFAALLFAAGEAWPADTPRLAAPVYKGAVPAIPDQGIKAAPSFIGNFGGVKALDCAGTREGGDSPGPWCFLSRDPIDKVKAFYDKAIGPMHVIKGTWGHAPPAPVQGYAVYVERAWFPGEGELVAPGFGYTAVSLHALPPPGAPGKEASNTDDSWAGQETFKFYSGTRHFNGFMDAVDWFGDPSKRKPAELNAFYAKHKRLESALFQRKGPQLEPVDEALRARYTEKRKQAEQKAMGAMPGQGQAAQMDQMARMMQSGQMPAAMPADQHATPEDAEFNAFMKKNPKVANRYTELTRKLSTLMQQGKFDEADAVDEELQKLVHANPELAAIERRADERSAAASAAGRAQENQTMAKYHSGMDKAVWGTWEEYIKAAEKEAFYTLIVIDRAFSGTEKDYSRDQALIAKETAGWSPHQLWGFADTSGQGARTAGSDASKEQAERIPSFVDDPKAAVGDAMKKGLKGLKSLF